jgi:hypothetical protein
MLPPRWFVRSLPDSRWRTSLLRALNDREYDRRIRAAYAEKNETSAEALKQEKVHAAWELLDWERLLITRPLVKMADRLVVDLPDYPPKFEAGNDDWEMSSEHGEFFLTNKGVAKLREAIRVEKKARREERAGVVMWLTLLASVIGAIAGVYKAFRP